MAVLGLYRRNDGYRVSKRIVPRTLVVLAASALTFGVTAAAAPVARADTTLTVTGFGDGAGSCTASACTTLRAAITAADEADGDQVTINLPGGEYVLTPPVAPLARNAQPRTACGSGTGGPLVVNCGADVTITGAGAASTVVEASALRSTTLFVEGGTVAIQDMTIDGGRGSVSAGVIDNSGDLTISASTISGGMDAGAGGGGIYNEAPGNLHVLAGTLLTGNAATSGGIGTGGGLYNAGTADVTGAVITGNSSADSGAGIFNGSGGQLSLTDTTVSGNGSGDVGAGVYNDGTLTVTGGQISGNHADDSQGGGVYNDSGGSVTLTGVTVSGNSADQGGGIDNTAPASDTTGASVVGSTISGNGAASDGAGVSNSGGMTVTGSTIAGNSVGSGGGGIYNNGSLTMVNSTLSRNATQSDSQDGTALYNDASGTANLSFDTLADNPGAQGTATLFNNGTANVLSSILAYAPGLQCAGSGINDAGGNVFGDTSCDVEATAQDPQLLPLAENGTNVPETMAIFSTETSPSPALGTTSGPCTDLGSHTISTDENGGSRPRGSEGGVCDAGAFQLQSATSTVSTGSASGATVTLTVLTEGQAPSYADGTGTCDVSGATGNCPFLRSAVQYADDHPGTTVAVELASGEYTLNPFADSSWGALHVTNGESSGTNLTIVGPAAGQTVIEGAGILGDDVLSIDNGATVALEGVTLDGGTGGSSDGSGAGDVYNQGSLTVTNATVSGGSASDTGASTGGGIQNAAGASLTLDHGARLDGNIGAYDGGTGGGLANAGTATLTDAVVSDNSASGDGGGIYNTGGLTLSGGQIVGNSVPSTTRCGGGLANEIGGVVSATSTTFVGDSLPDEGCGGAVYNNAGVAGPGVAPRTAVTGMSLSEVTISGSSANIGNGGGVFNGSSGTLTISGSTLSGNSAESDGGGISNRGSLAVDHSTLSGNSAVQGDGGGVYNGQGAQLTLVNSTLSANSTDGTDTTDATAFYNELGLASLSFDTLAGNAGNFNAATLYTGLTVKLPMFSNILAYGTGTQCQVDVTPLDGGGNVVGDSTCQLASREQNLDPLLLPLQGGTGQLAVMPLLNSAGQSSPAINTTDPPCTNAAQATVSDDEIGTARPSTVNGVTGCDAGAFQLAGGSPPPPPGPPVVGPTPPTVTAVSPAFGDPAGGNSVAITGTGFSTAPGGTTFVFGPNAATGVSCSSSTSCTVTAPAGSLGPVDVRATVGGLTSATNPGDVYTYQTSGQGSGGSVVCSQNQDTRFVCQAYLDLQGRVVDPQGVLTWAGGLNSSTLTRPQVVLGIDESIEYRTDIIQDWFRSYLNRAADGNAVNTFLTQLEQGLTEEQVQSEILGSPEYFTDSGGTNSGFLGALYQEALNRPIDSTGSSAWLAALSHLSRQQVALAILNSTEHRSDLVSSWYQRFLHRPVDSGGLQAWVAAMGSGTTDENVIAGIVGSAEYFSQPSITGTP